jgi:hypothetical protein
MPIQFGMVPDILKDRQNFQILKKSLSDLLCFRIMVKIVEAEHLSLARQREFRIEGRPINLVPQFKSSQYDPLSLKLSD